MSWIDLLGWASTALLLPMLCVALVNLLTAPRLERAGEPATRPRVSLLVPARNEAANLRANLPALLALDYAPLEILVLDDGSEDATAAVVHRFVESSPGRLRLLRGAPLPAGWLGKSWACHQLAAAASGDLLLFCDADVTPAAGAVSQTVALMERTRAACATALTRQRLGGWTEHAVVPLVVHLPVLALLPLRLVTALRAPSVSMANGQWLAFARDAYRATGGHAAVRAELVEDVALGRRVKRAGLRLAVAVAARSLDVRMYRDPRSLRDGFRKNLYPLVGGSPVSLAAAAPLFAMAALLPGALPLLGASVGFLPLALLLATRACGAALFGHSALSVALHPVGSALVTILALQSFLGARRGTLRWKGRAVGAPCA